MRAIASICAGFAVSACAAPSFYTATMPVEILRAEGQTPRMGEVRLTAGGNAEDDAFSFSVNFDHQGDQLGAPNSVGWTVKFQDYCRNRPSWVQSVLIGPSGQVWRGYRVAVPAGRDRRQDWSSGATGAEQYGGEPTPGLLEAMAVGGRYTLALEDDEGRRWHSVVIDTLTPTERQRLFSSNVDLVFSADPDMPVRSEQLLVAVPLPPSPAGLPPRVCP